MNPQHPVGRPGGPLAERTRAVFPRALASGALALQLLGLASPAAAPAVTVSFHAPDAVVRFYHLRVDLPPAAGYWPSAVRINGVDGRFLRFVNGRPWPWELTERALDGRIPPGRRASLRVACAWEDGRSYDIELVRRGAGADGQPEAESRVKVTAVAPAAGGYPYPGWTEHRLVVLAEEFGIPRRDEPQTIFLSAPVSVVRSWRDELRVAALDPATGRTREVPSQVLYEQAADTPAPPAGGAAPAPARRSPSVTTCQIAFLADVPARGRAFYLICYGNPHAQVPSYPTDLSLARDDQGVTWIENEFWRVALDPKSGQLFGATAKSFGKGDNRRFGLTENYPLHYNPDVWVAGRNWTHTHGWNPPPSQSVVTGPVAIVTRRWGVLPQAPEVPVQVTYHFFARCPYALVESTIDIREDLLVTALRNEELVFSPTQQVDHVGWQTSDGRIGYKAFTFAPGRRRGMVEILEPDAPFVCMTREANGIGFGAIRLAQIAGSRAGAPPVLASHMTLLADYGWGFRYWARILAFPWGDYQPDNQTVLNAGTYYAERSAYCVFPVGAGDRPEAKLRWLDDLSRRLRCPLRVDHQGAGPW